MDGERQNVTTGDWAPVYGELLSFDDTESRLPAIDLLEGFHPDGSSLYRRVPVPVNTMKAIVLAWNGAHSNRYLVEIELMAQSSEKRLTATVTNCKIIDRYDVL